MTAEHLLDAIGLLDDDLIQDAEARPAPVVPLRVRFRRWGSLAACLALVLAIGYGVTHLRMGSTSNSSSAPSFSSGMDAADSSAEATEPSASAPSSSSAGTWTSDESLENSAGSSSTNTLETGLIYISSNVYSIYGVCAEALPEGSRDLGVLSALSPDVSSPATDTETYVGCRLWEAPDGTLYVQLAQGGYAPAELVQP